MALSTNRVSGYDILPGNVAVMSKYAAYITTQRFIYLTQYKDDSLSITHNLGYPSLFIAWALDDRRETNIPSPDVYNPAGGAVALPSHSYYYFNVSADPKLPIYVAYEYESWAISMDKSNYTIRHHALNGQPAQIMRAYIRFTAFNDSFDAPIRTPINL